MSLFSPDTPFNYAPVLVQDGAASFSLLPMPLVYFAFGLPLVAALVMTRMGWAAFYAVLAVIVAFVSFPNSFTLLGALLLLSLPVFMVTLWGKEDVRFHKSLPLATCLVVYLLVPLGFPRTVSFQVDRCVEKRDTINRAAQQYLAEQPNAVLEMSALVPEHLQQEPGCQGPETSEYILNATKDEILVTCANPAHQRESLGPARSSFPRESANPPPINESPGAGESVRQEDSGDQS